MKVLNGIVGWRATLVCGSLVVLLANPVLYSKQIWTLASGDVGTPFVCCVTCCLPPPLIIGHAPAAIEVLQ